MFPFLHVDQSLEPTDRKRDQGASTVGREQVPAFKQNPARVLTARMWKVAY